MIKLTISEYVFNLFESDLVNEVVVVEVAEDKDKEEDGEVVDFNLFDGIIFGIWCDCKGVGEIIEFFDDSNIFEDAVVKCSDSIIFCFGIDFDIVDEKDELDGG